MQPDETQKLSEFWFTHQNEFAPEIFLNHFDEVTSLKGLGKSSLFRLAYTAGLFEKHYSGEEFPSPIQSAWEKKEPAWLEAMKPHLERLGKKDLSELAVVFANLNWKPPEAFMEQYFVAVELKRDKFEYRDIASMLAALGRIGATPPPKQLDALYTSGDTQLHKVRHDLDLLNMLRAMDDLEPKPARRYAARLQSKMENRLNNYSLEDLQEILQRSMQLKLKPSKIFLEKHFAASAAKLDAATPAQIADTIYCYGKFGLTPSEEFLNKFYAIDDQKLKEFNGSQISDIFHPFNRFGIKPPAEFERRLFSVAADNFHTFSPKDLSYTLQAAARLGIVPPDAFLKKLNAYTSKNVKTFDDQTLSTSLWSLAVFSVLKPLPASTLDIASTLIKEAKKRTLTEGSSHACRLACLRLKPEEAQNFPLAPLRETTSNGETKFMNALLAAKLSHQRGLNRIPALNTNTDFAFRVAGKRVLVEYDGPYHYIKNPKTGELTYDGSSRLMSELICDADPTAILIRIGYTEADRLVINEALLKKMKSEMRLLRPGPHELHIVGEDIDFIPILCAEKPGTPKYRACGPERPAPFTKTASHKPKNE